MVQAFVLSFSKKGTGGASTFVGLANYKRILKDKTFQQCLFNTVFYFLIQVPIMLIVALCLAQLLNNPKIKGKMICLVGSNSKSFFERVPMQVTIIIKNVNSLL